MGMLATMDELRIDEGLRGLIGQLWEHGYKTVYSCAHDSEAYIMFFDKGDGWFEENAKKFGLAKVENNDCCEKEFQDEVRKYGLNPENFIDRRKTCGCGAGVNGHTVYRGKLIQGNL